MRMTTVEACNAMMESLGYFVLGDLDADAKLGQIAPLKFIGPDLDTACKVVGEATLEDLNYMRSLQGLEAMAYFPCRLLRAVVE